MLTIFWVAFAVRVAVILLTPSSSGLVDLGIYRDGGQLILHGINPYDFADNPQLRQRLRTDDVAYHPYVCADQERWNRYAASNLPASLLFHAAVEAGGSALVHRLAYALADSLVAVLIAVFVAQCWQRGFSPLRQWLVAGGVGVLSPMLIVHGCAIPEEKGVQILLMLLALLLARSGNSLTRTYLSAAILGTSISFKLFGVFIFPACVYYATGAPGGAWFSFQRDWKRMAWYAALTALFTGVWFVPFLPEVLTVSFERLARNTDDMMPIHASLWRPLYWLLPAQWRIIRAVVVFVFLALCLYGLLRRRLSADEFSAHTLIWFAAIFLSGGSMDRLNMAFVPALLLVGSVRTSAGWILAVYYFLAGWAGYLTFAVLRVLLRNSAASIEWSDVAIGLGFVALYLALAFRPFRGLTTPAAVADLPAHAPSQAAGSRP